MTKKIEDFLIAERHRHDLILYYHYKLLLNASLFTSLFSLLYLFVSLFIGFKQGVYLMMFNVAGFVLLPLLMRTRASIVALGNLYVSIGTLAVVVIIYFSGGIHSPVFPWLIAPPMLALLLVNRLYSFIWTGVVLTCLILFVVAERNAIPLPSNFIQEYKLFFILLSSSGIILIVVLITQIFEQNTMRALTALQQSKEELALQNEEILEKNEILTSQREELLTTSEQLKELNDKKDYLMEILAHDLKSPMANIQALTTLIKADKYSFDSEEKHILGLVVDTAKKAQTLIQRILNSENLENIIYNLKLETEDVSAILQRVIDDIREPANSKNIRINLEAKKEEDFKALVDVVFLTQVFENLLTNAIKFSQSGKQIFITMHKFELTIRAEVRDEGPGIHPDDMQLLFRKYQKLRNKPTAGESSTGLGLSIVKHYVELLKGKVWCESRPGEGASFIVELPALIQARS